MQSLCCCPGNQMETLYFSADRALADKAIEPLPNFPVPVTHPQNGGFTLLPLQGPDYAAKVQL